MEQQHDASGASQKLSWEELLGSNHWNGLINPLDSSLRDLLLQCGDLCQVTADSFIEEETSKYHGYCRYSRSDLFDKVFFPKAVAVNYDVRFYLYAVSQNKLTGAKDSNWMGYIAVSTDAHRQATGRREIYVVWRGSLRPNEWNEDMLNTYPVDFEGVKVVGAWHDVYTLTDLHNAASARDQLRTYIKKLVQDYAEESLSIVCTGHSLGGALAIMSAFDMVKNGFWMVGNKKECFPVCAMVFENPKVGNKNFKDEMEKLPNLRVLCVKNKGDPVPDWPRILPHTWIYVHDIGQDVEVNSDKSPYVKAGAGKHNLQVVLHTVAGWKGKKEDFQWPPPTSRKRSLAVVNKEGDFLNEKKMIIPEAWWGVENKWMVLREDDGEWYEMPPEDYPIPNSSMHHGAR